LKYPIIIYPIIFVKEIKATKYKKYLFTRIFEIEVGNFIYIYICIYEITKKIDYLLYNYV